MLVYAMDYWIYGLEKVMLDLGEIRDKIDGIDRQLVEGLTFSYFSTRFKYNSKTAVGNTAGNLNNKGRFCEYDGKIYFANPYDDGHLYVMNSDCSNARALNTDSVYYINVCGNYIYYVRNNLSSAKENSFTGQMFGVYRTDLDGQNADTITTTKSGIAL